MGASYWTGEAQLRVDLEIRAPESSREDERTSLVCLLTNTTDSPQTVTLGEGKREWVVELAARSTHEHVIPWTARADVTVLVDGVPRRLEVALRHGNQEGASVGGRFPGRSGPRRRRPRRRCLQP